MMKVDEIVKYAAILIGANMVFKLFRGQGVVDIPTDPGSGTGVTTFTQQEAQTIADRLYYAMADIGTDESLMFASLQNLTAQQLIMVYNAFGTRPYAYSGTWFGLGYPLDLFGWFNKELSGNDLSRMKQIWAKTNLLWTV
jgi:hypothetical protein